MITDCLSFVKLGSADLIWNRDTSHFENAGEHQGIWDQESDEYSENRVLV